MTNIEKTKWIDKYLSDEMSIEERHEFERLLSEADLSYNGKLSFQQEVELQREIENTIRERGFREMLQKEEVHIRQKERVKKVALWGGSGVITTVAAVVLLLLLVAPAAHIMRDYSTTYVTQMEIYGSRGGTIGYADALNSALLLMQDDKWDEASYMIDEVLQQTKGAQDEPTREIYENAEWLKAVYLMHDGKVIRAKRLLRKIADSESFYKGKAIEVLGQLQ